MTEICFVPECPEDHFSRLLWNWYYDDEYPPMGEIIDWSLKQHGIKLYRIQCSYEHFKEHIEPDFDEETNTLALDVFQNKHIDKFFDSNPVHGHENFHIMRFITLSSFMLEFKHNDLQIDFQPLWGIETKQGYCPTVGASRFQFLKILDIPNYKFDMIMNVHDENPEFTTKYADIITPITAVEVRKNLGILVFPDYCPLELPYDKNLKHFNGAVPINYNVNGLGALKDSFDTHNDLKWTALYNIREFIKSDKKVYITPHQKVLLFNTMSDECEHPSYKILTENIEEAYATIEFTNDYLMHLPSYSMLAESVFCSALLFILQDVRGFSHSEFKITYL